MVALMASPSYFAHYGALLAPASVLVSIWVLRAAYIAFGERLTLRAGALVAQAGMLAVAIIATQVLASLDRLPVRPASFVHHLDQVIRDDGAPAAGRVSTAIEQLPADTCIVAVRPQALLDVNRLPSADRAGHTLLDVYGSALLAAQLHPPTSGHKSDAVAFPTVQDEIVRQSRECTWLVLSRRTCRQGRKDLTARTEAKLIAMSRRARAMVASSCANELRTPD
jgi:hypothetical protein